MKKKKNRGSTERWSCKHDYPIDEVWGTYHYLAQLIAPRLMAFKALDKHGYPPDFDDMRKWNKTIQMMADAFELLKYAASYTEDERRRIEQGLDLFRKYYCYLRD
jgi:hypothetical protein